MNIPVINSSNYFIKNNYPAQTKVKMGSYNPPFRGNTSNVHFGGADRIDFNNIYPIESSKMQPKIIWGKISASDNIVIFAHEFIDGDATSSGLALLDTIKNNFPDKKVHFYVPHGYPSFLSGLPDIEKIETDAKNIDKIGLAIAVDCAEENLDGIDLFKKAPSHIILDHHELKGLPNLYSMVHAESPSATHLLYNRLFKPLGIKISPQAAECILAGLITDTGCFTCVKAGDGSIQTEYELLEKYAPNGEFSEKSICNNFDKNENFSKELKTLQRKLIEYARSSDILESLNKRTVTYLALTQDMIKQFGVKDNPPDIKQAMRKVLMAMKNNANCGILFWDLGDGRIKISMRSNDFLNLINFAKFFGGNGHDHAAGFIIKKPFYDVVKEVLAEIPKTKL